MTACRFGFCSPRFGRRSGFRPADRKCIGQRNKDDSAEHDAAAIAVGPSNETEGPRIKAKSRQASVACLEHKQSRGDYWYRHDCTKPYCWIALLSICRKSILSCVFCLHRDLRTIPRCKHSGCPFVLPACLVNVTRSSARSSNLQES
jgi:hypothetical protein